MVGELKSIYVKFELYQPFSARRPTRVRANEVMAKR
jgi:hypothetical protein